MSDAKIMPWSFPEYLRDETANSRSMILEFRESRSKYAARYIDRKMPPKPQTDAMRLGTWLHVAVLEPERWTSSFVSEPDKMPDRRTKAGKAEWTAGLEANAGKESVPFDQYELVQAMTDAIWSSPVAAPLLEECTDREQTVVWKHDQTGLYVKARRDARRPGLVLDVKSVANIAPYPFVREVLNYDWHLQAAMYLDSERELTGHDASFAFVAVHKKPPHEVAVYELGNVGDGDDAAGAIDLGRSEYEAALRQIAKCMETGEWRNPWEMEPKLVDLPSWAGKESAWR